jgi:hypothetical protein
LGGQTLGQSSCLFLARLDPLNPSRVERHPPGNLHLLLDESCELARSLEDQKAMLIHLDVEYVNFDDPSAPFLHPKRIFILQEPLVRTIEAQLLEFGIHYLHVVTGQGHHFVWKIRKSSPVAKAISHLGICTTLDGAPQPEPLFPHVALLMEYLSHLIKDEASSLCEIPVQITAEHVGLGRFGMREMLSIDISEYGDPLSSRTIRLPFTVYRKPWITGLMDRFGIGDRVPEFFTLPLYEMDVQQLIETRHLPATIMDLAHRASVEIPISETGTRQLLNAYRSSGLHDFHRHFYETGHQPPAECLGALDRLPPCARHVLTWANDLLLKPSGIQLITRCLLADGWHPRHIAGLIASKFLDPVFDWASKWDDYDPVMRAEFYVRLFAGQIDQHIDSGVDFNCVSQQEKHFCWNPDNCSLEPFQKRIYSTLQSRSSSP